MYPQSELIRLAVRKAVLRRHITFRRDQCNVAATRIARPLAWLDRTVVLWQKISPLAKLAAIPLTVVAGRTLLPRAKILGTLLRWAPAVIGAAQSLRRK